MYGFLGLLIISFGAAFAIIWPITYIPITSKFFGKTISPRLIVCKLLAPFDAVLTLFLITGTWTGLTVTITGISTIIYSIMSGIGMSLGVIIMKKLFVPRWREQYLQKKKYGLR